MRLWPLIVLCFSFGFVPKGNCADTQRLESETAVTIKEFLQTDPGLKAFFNRAHGYAVFPKVAKGGLILGGAYGEGLVFVNRKLVGTSRLKQLTLGFQIGGQTYSQIVFFKTADAFKRFTKGELEFGAQASAVALDAGAGTNVDYENGVSVFTMAQGGLMYEAALAGQVFTYRAIH
ncbi:YSC84-related protein [Gallaecimonas pentaromativorans]|uniref:Lipid-binding SYLF domain-containing protein n=1 Tax=Gallaecimonas pentaromativorans TaxID=584787 RepID=A0A3N1NJI9_9GAMM|nr:lipid-binding SYLF domain-containing protein [Gallaecimonas pentaromativorans]ROQ18882.1 lipid-binding SYLF domain-containing protein [Gallaecimonas pentaromativorans]